MSVLADAAVPISQLSGSWQAVPAVLAPAGVALALFVQAFVRLRRRGRTDHAPWIRVPLFLAGLVLLTLPLVSPLDPVSDDYLLSGHMLEHVLIGDAAPALLLTALRGPLLFFFLPARLLGALARLAPLRSLVALLLRPRVSLAVWAAAIGCWHVPAAYDYTLGHETVHDLEHLTFVIAGLLVWAQLVDPARRRRLSVAGRLCYAVTLLAMGMVLSDVLIFSLRSLYPSYADQPTRLFGFSPVFDQQLGGLVMEAEQLCTLATFALIMLAPRIRARRADRAPARLMGAEP